MCMTLRRIPLVLPTSHPIPRVSGCGLTSHFGELKIPILLLFYGIMMFKVWSFLVFIYLFIYLFIIIIINNLFIHLFFVSLFVLSRARYPSSHVCTSSAVFIDFMYILKVWSFIHLYTPPPPRWDSGFKTRICPPTHPHATGKRRLEWGGFSE